MGYDLIIKKGRIADGTGNPWFYADIGIKAGRIVRIGSLDACEAVRIVKAEGYVVAPGFIDIHSHSDFAIISNPMAESKVKQGVTTEVNGNCGSSAGPLAPGHERYGDPSHGCQEGEGLRWKSLGDYFSLLEKMGISINIASLVGHGTIRSCVMGSENRKPTVEELDRMRSLVHKSMMDGALGLSSGLDKGLIPGCYADTEELIELCKVVARYGGFYATHQRNRQERVLEAAMEAIEIGEKAQVPVQISHFVPRFPDGNKTLECMGIIEAARRRGIDVTCDVVVPNAFGGYHWAHGSLATQVLPLWAYEGGRERLLERLRDPETRRRMRREAEPLWGVWRHGLWDKLILLESHGSPHLVGKTFEEIAKEKGVDPWEASYDILLEEGGRSCGILGASTEERDSIMVMKYPWSSLESDRALHVPHGPSVSASSSTSSQAQAQASAPSKERADANAYGAFPRIFRRYVRELGILTLEEAVRKVTSLPAQRCGFRDRGILKEGFWADIVIFSLDRIADRATIEEPKRFPEGIDYVIVNGQIVVEGGEHTGAKPGKVLRRSYL
ncbi:MAG: D-aminoacylase [Candidatus Bathyarchaeia archaeon]